MCLKELLDNALDACEAAGVSPKVSVLARQRGSVVYLSVEDNGPGMPPELVRKVIDYDIRVSDKAAYRSPTRGAQGNALKTIIGIPYALGVRGRAVGVSSGGASHLLSPAVDPAGNVRINHVVEESDVAEGTIVGVALPLRGQRFDPLHWVRSFAAFNPHATVRYQGNGDGSRVSKIYKPSVEDPRAFKKYVPTHPTSPHWYSVQTLRVLIFTNYLKTPRTRV